MHSQRVRGARSREAEARAADAAARQEATERVRAVLHEHGGYMPTSRLRAIVGDETLDRAVVATPARNAELERLKERWAQAAREHPAR